VRVIADLHGVKHEDVKDLVQTACSKHEIPFIIITGKSPAMKKIVSDAVKLFGFTARDLFGNAGRAVIE